MEVEITSTALTALARRIKAEQDGKQIRKDLVTELRAAAAPGVAAVKEKLRSMPRAARGQSPAMGTYLAGRTAVQVRTSGKKVGVRVRIPATPKLRGFAMAARRINKGSWRHRVYGRDVWVTQHSPIPGFFDDTLRGDHDRFRRAVVAVMRKTARRLTR